MAKMFLAAVMMAVLAVAAKADDSLLYSLEGETFDIATVTQQRALLATAGAAVYYSPSYSPSPSPAVYSPKASPAVYSPKASPPKSPVKPKSPTKKKCKFAHTNNRSIYIITMRAKYAVNWGKGRDALVAATAATYKKYSLPKMYKITVIGGGKQKAKKPFQIYKYKVLVPLVPCKGYKEGLRAALRTALRRTKGVSTFKIVA